MGKLIVFEGIDGSGKSTQFRLICERLLKENRDFFRVTFPQYDKPSSALIRMYLGGQFGDDPDAVNAYAASSFFAVDRFASYRQVWFEHFNSGGLVLTDRYTTSNAIHQGAKLAPEQREKFFEWLYEYEFTLMGLPEPGLVIYMDIPAREAALRLRQRQLETSTAADIHERDSAYLEKCAECGGAAADYYGWRRISCLSGGNERSETDINNEIYNTVCGFLGGAEL